MYEKNIKSIREAIQQALSARGNHKCQNNPEGLCPVESVLPNGQLMVANKNYPTCPNYTTFGSRGLCNLPIRAEIYKKYAI